VLAGLERYENGAVIPSLANVLRLWKPVIIMDEAHKARTKPSFETLERFAPSCIIEFTATPETEHGPDRRRPVRPALVLRRGVRLSEGGDPGGCPPSASRCCARAYRTSKSGSPSFALTGSSGDMIFNSSLTLGRHWLSVVALVPGGQVHRGCSRP